MKFSVAPEQKGFFQEKGEIEFEGLLNPEELIHCQNCIREALANQLECAELDKKRPEELYLAGRDLWRSSAELKKIIGLRRFGEVASQLVGVKMLRLGYDQYFPSPKHTASTSPQTFRQLLRDTKNLQSYGSIQGVLCGLMLCLASKTTAPPHKSKLSIFSTTPGNGVFFRPNLQIDFSDLFDHRGTDYYLIVYANVKSVYTLNREDLHSRDWIGIGYDFGDKLSDELHPIVFK